MTTVNKLPLKDFKAIVKNSPLFAMDLVVLDASNKVLLGKRINAPAKGYWFVPGGRVYKNESLDAAFARISKSELGVALDIHQAKLLGLYDHFYEDSFFGDDVSTHYINASYLVRLDGEHIEFPKDQHNEYKWLDLTDLAENPTVHKYSKIFLPELNKWFSNNDKYPS